MIIKAKSLKLLTGKPIAILPIELAKLLNVGVGERIKIKKYGEKKEIVAVIDIARIKEKTDYIYASDEIFKFLKIKKGDIVEISPAERPLSIKYIKDKLEGKKLNYNQLYSIIKSIVNNELTEPEIAYFISSMYFQGMYFKEIIDLINAMVNVGDKITFKNRYVLDKHCIGGIAGNRTTPIVTSIIAYAINDLKIDGVMPKTSSRAITSASGTADVIEVLARVEFDIQEIKRIVKKVKACLVWGGGLSISPADDKIIEVERLINLDPKTQLIASIMSKKIAMGSNRLIIDIPYGRGSKIEKKSDAEKLKKKFEQVGKRFNIKIKCLLTNGSEPIGNGIGPVMELLDVIKVLKNSKDKPRDLYNKSLFLASELLSMIVEKEKAKKLCKKYLDFGYAFESFKRIIKAQGGSIKNRKFLPSDQDIKVRAEKRGRIVHIDNKKINFIARLLGCPTDKGAGIYIKKHVGEKVDKSETIAILYAETKEKLRYAYRIFNKIKPIGIRSI